MRNCGHSEVLSKLCAILLPIWPDVCHYDGWSPNISARDRVPTVAKSVDFAPRDYRKPARWGQTN